MSLHLYSDWVLKAAGLSPRSVADLGALEALRATYNVSDHAHPSPPIVPATSSDQQPLRLHAPNDTMPVMGALDDPPHGSGGDPFASPSLPREQGDRTFLPAGQVATATPARGPPPIGEHSATVVLEPKGHEKEEDEVPSFQSSASYEEASGSSSQIIQLELELRTLRKEKGREEACLKNLARQYDTLKERYAASVRRTDSVRAEMDGVHAERDSTQMEREAFQKEMEVLRTDRDETLQSNVRLLGQLEDSHDHGGQPGGHSNA
ncbi:hypothetical protein LIER_13652 [Lithospermum erythrorhizon]|uniref:Uncharacterized protein n=1 Tax=Lithospermum erythrorhizon TaxID=34254 RepID=A0AAV3PYQ2_LITER